MQDGEPSGGRAGPTTALPRGQSPRAPWPVRITHAAAGRRPVSLRLGAGRCILGAGVEADLILEDATVSRRHAELELVPEGIAVRDLGSRNGTSHLGHRVERMVLSLPARLQLGSADVLIEPEPEEPAQAPGSSERPEPLRYGDLVAASPASRETIRVLQRLEGSLVNVLVEGESGTGKELVARAIHHYSMVAGGPFIAVNCGAIHKDLVLSELFGHRKGAFTGASDHRTGAFEAANGGTLFLDELGELPLDVQPVLLRALEERAVTPLGETRPRKVNVRLVAATNRRLDEEARAGRFREDLYYRLRVVRLRLPPLRERPEDVRILAQHFASHVGIARLPADVMERLAAHEWPGNARELKHAIDAYAALGTLLLDDDLDAEPSGDEELGSALLGNLDVTRPYDELKEQVLHLFSRAYLKALLEHTGGNVSEAARVSGMERSYLNKLVNRQGLRKSRR